MKIHTINSFEQLDYQRKEFMRLLDQHTPAQLHFKTAPDHWSMVQVADHLYHSEKLAFEYIRKKLNSDMLKEPDAGVGSVVRRMFLNAALGLPIKYKAPLPALIPSSDRKLSEVKEDWAALRKDYRHLMENLDKPFFQKELFKHPIAGKMKLDDAFRFMHQHTERHVKQVERIIEHGTFPGSAIIREAYS